MVSYLLHDVGLCTWCDVGLCTWCDGLCLGYVHGVMLGYEIVWKLLIKSLNLCMFDYIILFFF